ncbi:MAG: hypothetical protein Q8M17_11355 [Actinomycetota bacterium]|nr:hypothetical protein [Actinomycetota bacterium]
MTWLFAVVAILVVTGAFLASLGLMGQLPEAEPDLRPDRIDDGAGSGVPEFDVVVRGYRMDEVDAELERLKQEVDRLSRLDDPASPPSPDPSPRAGGL